MFGLLYVVVEAIIIDSMARHNIAASHPSARLNTRKYNSSLCISDSTGPHHECPKNTGLPKVFTESRQNDSTTWCSSHGIYVGNPTIWLSNFLRLFIIWSGPLTGLLPTSLACLKTFLETLVI